jgi:N-acyl homoserine lactone hydrolase
MDDQRLYILDCGAITLPRRMVFNVGDEESAGSDDMTTVPVPAFLVTHPKGNVLFEGGLTLEMARATSDWPSLTIHMTESQHVRAQLESVGLRPDSVRYVVQSHLHLDHVGAIGHFPDAEFLVHRREWEWAHDPDWFAQASYPLTDIDRENTSWTMLDIDEGRSAHDIFGDGAVRAIFAPGHTPGLMALVVAVAGKHVVLTSDAADTRRHFDHQSLPTFVDSRAARRSVDRLRALRQKLSADVIFGHDAEQWARLPKGLKAYE